MTPQQIKAMKMALEALEYALNKPMWNRPKMTVAITALEKALAQTQEPVALPCCGYADASAIKWNPHNQVVQCHNCGQGYTATPQCTTG